jgi:acyl-CoA synthetase (AMP-forming)/AMP-acid ligase II/acyl carrier protein
MTEGLMSEGVTEFVPGRATAVIDGLVHPCSIGNVIREHARERPNEIALAGSAFAPLSYAELWGQIEQIRSCLRECGLGREARVAVAIANSAEAALTIVAVACSAAAVPLDPKLTVNEVERCLMVLQPGAVIVPRDGATNVQRVAEQRGIPVIVASARPDKLCLELSAPRIGEACLLDDPDPDAPAFILHTSGTTGESNLVPFSHRNVLASAERVQSWFELTPQDRCLNISPVYYSHALTTTIIPPLLTGGSVAFPGNPLNVDLSEWLVALRPTWYSAGPTVHLAVLEKALLQPDLRSRHRLRLISSAGARLPLQVQERLQNALGVPVLEHYGSSETAQIASNMPPPRPCKPGTCGVPWAGIIKIVGEDGRPVPVGEEGEILVTGPSVMRGYLNSPELNRAVFVDGWYRTGDVGSLDAEGFLVLRARKRELINRGAEKIAPVEIDNALLRHPQVLEAAAFAVPHPRLGEDVAAAVVLRPGSTVTPAELRDFLGGQIAAFKIPRRISVVDGLPKGITGKVQRTRLAALAAETGARSASLPPVTAPHGLKRFAARMLRMLPFVGRRSSPIALGMQSMRSSRAVETRRHLSGAALQAELLKIWKRLLNVDDLGVDDDFFEKGGSSLLAMDLHVELQRLMGKTLPESLLSEASTVRQLAEVLENA